MTPAEAAAYAATLPPDEPCFVFRARDAFAPAAVRSWAVMCCSCGSTNAKEHEKTAGTRAKGRRAMALADEMREWQGKYGSKLPD